MTDSALLKQLFSGGEPAQQAWKEFLLRYSRLFLKIIWQFEKHRDTVMERYLFVCSKLAAENFAILRKFNPEGQKHPPKLSTWLTIVVKNLCVEAHRQEHGRKRFPRALLRMTPLDRRVFQLYYWEGLSEQEIQHTVRFSNDVQNSRVDSSLARIKTLLMDNTLREQWKPVMLTYNDNINSGWPTQNDSDLSSVHDLLESSLVLLSVQERAVVRLRFWEDLSAREIADILHISPIRKVYALLEYALKKLRRSALRELRE